MCLLTADDSCKACLCWEEDNNVHDECFGCPCCATSFAFLCCTYGAEIGFQFIIWFLVLATGIGLSIVWLTVWTDSVEWYTYALLGVSSFGMLVFLSFWIYAMCLHSRRKNTDLRNTQARPQAIPPAPSYTQAMQDRNNGPQYVHGQQSAQSSHIPIPLDPQQAGYGYGYRQHLQHQAPLLYPAPPVIEQHIHIHNS
eukprot:m.28169 g.28169  ORF g.28169 m.28169 type:complete len:197 (-) comp7978_c2_seq1:29-619(-)